MTDYQITDSTGSRLPDSNFYSKSIQFSLWIIPECVSTPDGGSTILPMNCNCFVDFEHFSDYFLPIFTCLKDGRAMD